MQKILLMLIYITICLIFLFLLKFEWKIKGEFSYDSTTKKGKFFLNIFTFMVFKANADVDLDNKEIKVKFKKKEKVIKFNSSAKDENSIIYFVKNIDTTVLGHIDVKFLSFNVNVGVGNAFYSAILVQFIRMVYTSAISLLKSQQVVETNEFIVADFQNEILKVNLFCLISVSIIEILFGVIRSLHKKISKKIRRAYDY